MCACMLIHFSCVWLFATLWTVACHAFLSVGFSRQEYWSGLPCPPPEGLPDPGIEPASLMFPALAGGFFATSTTLLLLSRSVVSDSLRSHGLQHARPPCHSPSPGVCSNSCPLSWWCHPTIQPSRALSSPSPAFNLSQHQGLFHWVSSLHQVAKVLEFQLQYLSFHWIFSTDFL